MKLPNMAADMIKSTIDYDTLKRSLQHVEFQSTYTKEWIEFYRRDNELLNTEVNELIETTRKLMDIFGINTVREKD